MKKKPLTEKEKAEASSMYRRFYLITLFLDITGCGIWIVLCVRQVVHLSILWELGIGMAWLVIWGGVLYSIMLYAYFLGLLPELNRFLKTSSSR